MNRCRRPRLRMRVLPSHCVVDLCRHWGRKHHAGDRLDPFVRHDHAANGICTRLDPGHLSPGNCTRKLVPAQAEQKPAVSIDAVCRWCGRVVGIVAIAKYFRLDRAKPIQFVSWRDHFAGTHSWPLHPADYPGPGRVVATAGQPPGKRRVQRRVVVRSELSGRRRRRNFGMFGPHPFDSAVSRWLRCPVSQLRHLGCTG